MPSNCGWKIPRSVAPSQVPRLTWKSVGWTNPPGAGKKTLEPQNSKIFNSDHQNLVLIGKLLGWRSYRCWCHSLIFIGCPARSSFRSPPVCNFAMAVTVLLDLLIFITCICDQKHFHISCLQFSITPPLFAPMIIRLQTKTNVFFVESTQIVHWSRICWFLSQGFAKRSTFIFHASHFFFFFC